jgi:LL-diaminopimelate aminotransferase
MKPADRLTKIPPYLFADLDRQKRAIRAGGGRVIDLSIGDPDLPPPRQLVEELKSVLGDMAVHRYPSYTGCVEFRTAAAKWLARRHQAEVDPDTEMLALIGSKEGIAHLILAAVNPGDITLVPSPGYPVYSQATHLAGGLPHYVPLLKENNFLPDFDSIPRSVLKKAKILFLNYPNNPTASLAARSCFEKAVDLAREHKFLICHDAAYIEIHSSTEPPISILSVPGAKEVAVEFHSFSKTFCICGWRIGFAAGNKDALEVLAGMKQNMDSGVFTAIQKALVYAMENLEGHIDGIRSIYASRKQTFSRDLERMGFRSHPSNATFYIWAEYPQKMKSIEFCKKLLEKTGIAATPGVGFGQEGEGFVRFSLTIPTEQLEEAAVKMAKF